MPHPHNPYLAGPLGRLYLRTALPIILVMGANGLLAVVDALFLGLYVGPTALAAVTLMFPAYMLMVALATLVSSGLSSVVARRLGAGDLDAARDAFAAAHGLALAAAGLLIGLFLAFGHSLTGFAAGGAGPLAELGWVYLSITVLASPLAFVLAVNSDTLRNEGRVGLMAAVSLSTSLANIALNYALIAMLEMGVAGSAVGTALAQALALAAVLTFRLRGRTALTPGVVLRRAAGRGWGEILALGAPMSLGFVGLSLGAASVIAALRMLDPPGYAETVAAYGILTRVMTFAFLPLLGLSHAMQTITGSNHGARAWGRADRSLRIALVAAGAYCAAAQIAMTVFARGIGAAFVDDAAVVAEVARILPVTVAGFVLAGPLMMVATHFQALGDARRAAVLGLAKPYAFAIPATFLLPAAMGEPGVWLAAPLADGLLLVLTLGVLAALARRGAHRWGLFAPAEGVRP